MIRRIKGRGTRSRISKELIQPPTYTWLAVNPTKLNGPQLGLDCTQWCAIIWPIKLSFSKCVLCIDYCHIEYQIWWPRRWNWLMNLNASLGVFSAFVNEELQQYIILHCFCPPSRITQPCKRSRYQTALSTRYTPFPSSVWHCLYSDFCAGFDFPQVLPCQHTCGFGGVFRVERRNNKLWCWAILRRYAVDAKYIC